MGIFIKDFYWLTIDYFDGAQLEEIGMF